MPHPLPKGRTLPIQQFDPLKPTEMRPAPRAIMRPRTWAEATRDLTQQLYEALAAQPLGQVSDALGVTNLKGESRAFDEPPTSLRKSGMTR